MRQLRQYKARVRPEYETIVGDSDTAMARRSTLGLHFFTDLDPIKKDGGHKLVVAALETLDKLEVLRKQQKFDDIKRSVRRCGPDVTDNSREKERQWNDVPELDRTRNYPMTCTRTFPWRVCDCKTRLRV